jgi:hypothetical protein
MGSPGPAASGRPGPTGAAIAVYVVQDVLVLQDGTVSEEPLLCLIRKGGGG